MSFSLLPKRWLLRSFCFFCKMCQQYLQDSPICTVPMGSYFRDRVSIRTFFTFHVFSYISVSLFSVFWLHSCKEYQFSLHVHNNEKMAKFDFYLCFHFKFHNSSFRVPILAAEGPYWVPISKLGGPYKIGTQ